MAAIVCRIAKLKTLAHVGAVRAQNSREHDVGHADPERSHLNQHLIGGENLVDDVRAKLAEVDGPLRKNGVLAVEMVLTAGADWFDADPARAEAFTDRAIECLQDRYGDRLVSVDLHMDEAAPHVHAVIVPLETKAGGKVKLNCRGEFGGAQKLKQLQDWAGELGKPLGLERGKSRVVEYGAEDEPAPVHKPPKEFRREQEEATAKAKAEVEAAAAERQVAADLREAAAADRNQAAHLANQVKARAKAIRDKATAEVDALRQRAADLRRQAATQALGNADGKVVAKGKTHDLHALVRGTVYKSAGRPFTMAEKTAREALERNQTAKGRLAQAEARTTQAGPLTRWWHRWGETPLRQEAEATGAEAKDAEARKAELWERAKKSPEVEQAKAHAESLRRAAYAEVNNMTQDADSCEGKASSIERVHELGQYSPEARQAAAAAQAAAQSQAQAARERMQAAQLERARPNIFDPSGRPKLPGDKAEGKGSDGPKFMPQPAGPGGM